jgi:general secretion pathway protein D
MLSTFLCLALLLSAAARAQDVTLNLVNVDIESAVRTIAQATGRDVVVDPRVKGNVTLQFERPLTRARAWEAIQAQLRVAGYAMVQSGSLWRVVPEAEAKLQGGPVAANGGTTPGAADQIVTQIFRLQHEQAANVLNVVRPLVAPNNVVTVTPGVNAVVVTDYAENVRRIARIIAALDVPPASDFEVIPLKHATAADLALLVQRLIDQSGAPGTAAAPGAAPGGTAGGGTYTIAAEPRSNSLIVRTAGTARIAFVRDLVARLDQPTAGSGNIHVIYLKNAEAAKLAQTLRAAYGGGSDIAAAVAGAAGAAAPPGAPRPVASFAAAPGATPAAGGISIQADPSTNALLIFAPEPVYRQLRQVVDKLDARRAQVYVESLIVEVSADRAESLGIQWQSLIGRTNNNNVGIAGTNFSSGGNNIIGLAASVANASTAGITANTAVPGAGLNLGLLHRFSGAYSLGALARFFEQAGGANILSTPNLLTLDNEEARIVIGQNVPFLTGQYAQTGNAATVTPFQTIERRDVGLTLRVKPQVSEGGTVKLTVYQESSSVADTSSTTGPTTNKRSIESTVLVEDGQTVALGGLLQDSSTTGVEKVPGLGDLPGVGLLFRYDNQRRTKTNLMVFLRPVVLRSPEAADSLTVDRYRAMQGMQTPKPGAAPVGGGLPLPANTPQTGQPLFPAQPQQPSQSAPQPSLQQPRQQP